MNPWRLWQQGFCMLALSFLLGIGTYVYHVIQVAHFQRQIVEEEFTTALRTMAEGQTSVVGPMLNWSAVITFIIAIGLLLLGLISYCSQRARVSQETR
jgi:hypothetical protein